MTGHDAGTPTGASTEATRAAAYLSLAPALAAATAVAGTVARIGYEDFYRATGTTLDAVGLSTARLFTVGGVVVLALIGVASSIVVPIVAVRAMPLFDSRRTVASGAVGVTAVGVAVAGPQAWPTVSYMVYASLGAMACAAPAALGIRIGSRRPADRAAVASAAVAALIAVVVGHGVLSGALEYGRAVADGREIPSNVARSVLDIAALPVCVFATNGGQLPGVPPDQLLLGSSTGTHVLLRPGPDARATTVPSGAVIIRGRKPAPPGSSAPRTC